MSCQGRLIKIRSYNDQATPWSEVIRADNGELFYIRDWQTRFSDAKDVQKLFVIGASVNFEARGDLVTQINSVNKPEVACAMCDPYNRVFPNRASFELIRDTLQAEINSGRFLIAHLKSRGTELHQRDFSFAQDFVVDPEGQSWPFTAFLCTCCNSILASCECERSPSYAAFTCRRYPDPGAFN